MTVTITSTPRGNRSDRSPDRRSGRDDHPPALHTVPAAAHLFRRLRELGLSHVYGVPGDFSLGLLERLESEPGPAWVGAASELGAAYLADGHARAHGLAALFTTAGVGELSASVGVAGAMAEDVAVLHVVSGPSTAASASGANIHHTLADGDHGHFLRAAAEYTHLAVTVRPGRAAQDIDLAVTAWLRARRPVHLVLPVDLCDEPVPSDPQPLAPDQADTGSRAAARALMREFLSQHASPTLVVGHLAGRRGLHRQVLQVAGVADLVAVLPNGKGLVDHGHPRYVGVYNGKLSSAEVVRAVESDSGRILLGCVLADTTTGGLSHRFAADSTLTLAAEHVSWGERRVEGTQFAAALSDLHAELRARDTGRIGTTSGTADGAASASRAAIRLPPALPAALPSPDETDAAVTQSRLWSSIAALLPPHSRLYAETGTSHYGALDIAFPPDTRFEAAVVWSAIGFALPAALGSTTADPARRCLAVVGDGAAQMVSQELGLLARADLNPVIVLVNNAGYTVERVIRGPEASYNGVADWNWTLLPRAMGVGKDRLVTARVTQWGELVDALRAAFADPDRAHLVEVMTDRLDTPPTLTTMAGMLRAKQVATAPSTPTQERTT